MDNLKTERVFINIANESLKKTLKYILIFI